MPRRGRRRRRHERPRRRDSSPISFLPQCEQHLPLARTEGARSKPARSRSPREAGGDPDPGARSPDAASSREARPPAGVSGGADSGLHRLGRGPRSLLCPGQREEQPLPASGRGQRLRRRPRRAGARPARREPAGRRAGSKGRGARRANSVPGPRPGGPGWTRQLQVPAAGQPVTPVSPQRRGSGSENQPPGGAAARAAGGGGGGAGPQGRRPAHPEVVVAAAARAAHWADPGGASAPGCRAARCAPHGRVELRPPGSCGASCWGCAGGREGGWRVATAGGVEAPGGLEVAPPGARCPPSPSAPGPRPRE